MNAFLNSRHQVRNGWWILIFFAVLASMLIPLLVLTGGDVSIGAQAVIVAIASCVCQLLRRRPVSEVTGRLDRHWPVQLLAGCAFGAALMLIPAGFLRVLGSVRWEWSGVSLTSVAATIPLVLAVAATEELLFRGFIFQRLIDGAGATLAQLILAAYFLLTHAGGLATAGDVRYLASTNIFIASLLFGLSFLRTRSLALPLGLHFGANFTQGSILGFGVSGTIETAALVPLRHGPDWMTGGKFGLEGSMPGLIAVAAATAILYRWRRHRRPLRIIATSADRELCDTSV